jgi:hypothetical protein
VSRQPDRHSFTSQGRGGLPRYPGKFEAKDASLTDSVWLGDGELPPENAGHG